MQRFTTLALLIAAVTTAHADDDTDHAHAKVFSRYADVTGSMLHDPAGHPWIEDKAHQPDGCTQDIAKAKVEGVAADTKLEIWGFSVGVPYKVLTLDGIAKEVCAPYERAYHISEIAHVFGPARKLLSMLTESMDLAKSNPDLQKRLEGDVKQCFEAADRSDKLGLGDFELTPELHFDEVRAKVCEPLAKVVGSWSVNVKKAHAAEVAELAAPFKAVGIKGEKLDFCIRNAEVRIYGARGMSLGPSQIKKANVLFTLWQDSQTGVYSLQRYTFKGDKYVGMSEQKFPLMPGPGAYR